MKTKIMPQNQLKLGTTMNGKENLALFIAETLDAKYEKGIIDYSNNKEFIKLLDDLQKNNNKNK